MTFPRRVEFWRTITQILCGDCLKYRDSAVLARLFGNGSLTCSRCGVHAPNPPVSGDLTSAAASGIVSAGR